MEDETYTARYEEAFRVKRSLIVAMSLAELDGVSSFAELERCSKVEGNLLLHHLNRLQSLGVVEKEGRGTYRLRYKTPLCFISEEFKGTSIVYFGLLGRRGERREPETTTAIDLLRKERIEPKLIYVVTSPEAMNEWKSLRLPFQWILCYEDEIVDIDAIREKVRPQMESLLRDHVVIMDCTSSTKPATIAYYQLAEEHMVPLIYVYEEKRQLRWLISRADIRKRLRID